MNTFEEMVAICAEWLERQTPTKTINTRHSSYAYKHMVETWAKSYVSNDAFIEAVKRDGRFPWRESVVSGHILVGISERVLQKTVWERVKTGHHYFLRRIIK